MGERLIDQDTRFWAVYDEHGTSLGVFMYGDLIRRFCNGYGHLNNALAHLKTIGHTWKVIGDICPLEVDSDNPIIQRKKTEFRKRENDREKQRAKSKGFKLETTIRFGKHSGKKIKDIIDNNPHYWNWMVSNKIILLHPEITEYCKQKSMG